MHPATRLPIDILPQPDDVTCGPTCLQAVYRYFGDEVPLADLIPTVPMLPVESGGRGTVAAMLGWHALRRGYRARMYVVNLNVFDPTWFPSGHDGPANPAMLREKLRLQAAAKGAEFPKLAIATSWYLEFLDRGGEVAFGEIEPGLIEDLLSKKHPILTGLSSTYLYHEMREQDTNDVDDDIRGLPQGHFVILMGSDPARRTVLVADPHGDRSAYGSHVYEVAMSRVIGAILLGVLTYDGNLLIIEPGRSRTP